MRRIIARLRESLFTIPAIIVGICIAAAALALTLDSGRSTDVEQIPLVLNSTVTGARAIATTVAGATITVAAIVFSITSLSTQITASQYSPRAVGGFFEDSYQQATIGLVVGTFTYSLLVLAGLGSEVTGEPARPSVSATGAIALGIGSAIAIVGYINHSLRRMQIDSVVQRIAGKAIKALERYLQDTEDQEPSIGLPTTDNPRSIRASRSGWITALDGGALLEAIPNEATLRIDVRVGEAIARDDRIAVVWPEPGPEWDGSTVLDAIAVARERSLELDPTFGIRQLVDIALRALSPGVNDPTTAVDVIHHLKTPIRTVLSSNAPRRVFSKSHGRQVFLTNTMSRSDYVHMAFTEIRLASNGQPSVLSALLEVLGDLKGDMADAALSGRVSAVDEQIKLTLKSARESDLPAFDLERILRRFEGLGDGFDTENQ